MRSWKLFYKTREGKTEIMTAGWAGTRRTQGTGNSNEENRPESQESKL